MTKCTIYWTDKDVEYVEQERKETESRQTVEPPLTEDEKYWILRSMEDTHDANIGINWDTIDFWIDRVIDYREAGVNLK